MAVGYIKLSRAIDDHPWPSKLAKNVYIYLLMNACFSQSNKGNLVLNRGQIMTTLDTIADETCYTKQNIRTTLKKLVEMGELTNQSTRQYTLYTIENYDFFTGASDKLTYKKTQATQKSNSQLTHDQHTTNTELTQEITHDLAHELTYDITHEENKQTSENTGLDCVAEKKLTHKITNQVTQELAKEKSLTQHTTNIQLTHPIDHNKELKELKEIRTPLTPLAVDNSGDTAKEGVSETPTDCETERIVENRLPSGRGALWASEVPRIIRSLNEQCGTSYDPDSQVYVAKIGAKLRWLRESKGLSAELAVRRCIGVTKAAKIRQQSFAAGGNVWEPDPVKIFGNGSTFGSLCGMLNSNDEPIRVEFKPEKKPQEPSAPIRPRESITLCAIPGIEHKSGESDKCEACKKKAHEDWVRSMAKLGRPVERVA